MFLFALAALAGPSLAAPSPAGASNDPSYNKQYGVKQVNAPSAWRKTRGAGGHHRGGRLGRRP